MQLKDRNKTNIKPDAITSFFEDRHVVATMGQGSSNPCIKLTVGSCQLNLIYDKVEDRDSDLKEIKDKAGF
jgi:hypothetical protein